MPIATIPDGFVLRTILVPTADSGRMLVIAGGWQTIYEPGHGPLCSACGRELTAADMHEPRDAPAQPTVPPSAGER